MRILRSGLWLWQRKRKNREAHTGQEVSGRGRRASRKIEPTTSRSRE